MLNGRRQGLLKSRPVGASLAAVASASPFLLSALWHRSEWEMELVAAVLSGVMGALAALWWLDLNQGMLPRAACARLAIGAATAAAALFGVLFVAVLALSAVSAGTWPDWSTVLAGVVWLLTGLLAAPTAAALASGRYSPGSRKWVVEAVAVAWGLVAWLHIIRQVAVLSRLVAFGPIAVPWALWHFPYVGVQPGQVGMVALLITGVPAAAFAVVRLRTWQGARAAAALRDALLGLGLLGASYRLPALVVVVALVGKHLVAGHQSIRRWLCGVAVLLCLLPMDISLQRGRASRPQFLPTMKGDFTMAGWRHGPRYGYVVLDTGSHQTLYYEPRWVLVWGAAQQSDEADEP